MTAREEIKAWFDRGNKRGVNSHMIVACDTFDHSDYPVFVGKNEDVRERVDKTQAQEMTRVMEVYSYSMDIEEQLNKERAFNF